MMKHERLLLTLATCCESTTRSSLLPHHLLMNIDEVKYKHHGPNVVHTTIEVKYRHGPASIDEAIRGQCLVA